MIIALTLGLIGSLSHCTGMCGGIVLLLNRALGGRRGRGIWLRVHAGRVLAYAALGLLAGLLGSGLSRLFEGMQLLQGAVALYAALAGIYFALVLLGIAPSPEALFPGLVRRWRVAFQKISLPGTGSATRAPALLIGFLWGLLPCGLTLTALFTTAVTASPMEGALRMAVFGLGTLPALVSVRWLSERIRVSAWPRYGAAAAVTLFSLQLGLRAMAAYGFVGHAMLGEVMLW